MLPFTRMSELGLWSEIQQVHATGSPGPAVANFDCKLFPAIVTQVGWAISLPWIQAKFKMYGN